MARVIVNVPATAKRGEVIEIRTQIGELVPRNIITRFTCSYNGVEVFRADLHPAIAANPLLSFTTVATESGTLEFRWSGDNGFAAVQNASITVV
jgi:sulfur-oxidizing protein SoxZ